MSYCCTNIIILKDSSRSVRVTWAFRYSGNGST